MFKKKPQLKPASALRSSDRRKIANELISDLCPSAAPADSLNDGEGDSIAATAAAVKATALRNSILPEATQAAKFMTTAGPNLDSIHGTVYLGNHGDTFSLRPLWVRVDGGHFFPTVDTLWHNPGLLPTLLTHATVIEKLRGGADLMIPGLVGPPFPAGAVKGALVQIASHEKPWMPLVVGVCTIDVARLEKAVGEHGKAVRVLHSAGDELFLHGNARRKVPDEPAVTAKDNDVEAVTEGIATVGLDDTQAPSESAEQEPSESAEQTGVEGIRELDTKEIDTAFFNAALYGLYEYTGGREIDNLNFPLSSSAFISTLVLPFLPPTYNFPPHNHIQRDGPHPSLQLKKSSWKNAAKFLKYLEKCGLVKIKTRGGGELIVLDISGKARDVLNFEPYMLPRASPKQKPAGATASTAGEYSHSHDGASLQIIELYRPLGRANKFFDEVKASISAFYSAAELRQLLNDYVESNNLINSKNKRLVKLDYILVNSLFSSSPADSAALSAGDFHKRDELAKRLARTCAPYYRIVRHGDDPTSKPKAGPAPRVTVVVERRQGKKTVTRIAGLEPFGVQPKELAEELQRLCAGSATTGQAAGSKAGALEVLVQGPQARIVETCLEKRGVPKKFVVVTDKTANIGKALVTGVV